MTTPAVVAVAASVERNEQSAAYFDAAAEGRLLIRRCEQCGHSMLARRFVCHNCGGTRLAWETAAGTGELRSWAVNPTGSGETPATTFGLVELSEGPWVESLLLVGADVLPSVGLSMVVVFVRGPVGEVYPAFAPASTGQRGRRRDPT